MTQLEVIYQYEMHPTESAMAALGTARQVYGIRHLHIDEGAKTIRLEYDATRLNAAEVYNLLRATGIDVQKEIPQAAPAAAAQ